jgi:hypothetical protein
LEADRLSSEKPKIQKRPPDVTDNCLKKFIAKTAPYGKSTEIVAWKSRLLEVKEMGVVYGH